MRTVLIASLLAMTGITGVEARDWRWFVTHTRSGPYCAGRPTTYYADGHRNADGSRYNPYGLSAATWRYPFGTVLQVMNCWNGKTVRVTVKDRGPGRHQVGLGIHLDLSYGAAKVLGLASSERNTRLGRLESGWTTWSVVSMGDGATMYSARRHSRRPVNTAASVSRMEHDALMMR